MQSKTIAESEEIMDYTKALLAGIYIDDLEITDGILKKPQNKKNT